MLIFYNIMQYYLLNLFVLLQAELAAAVRRRARGDTSEEDEDLGLPRSPPSSPPKVNTNYNINLI